MSGKSCLTNLIEFFEGVTKKVDEGSAVDVVHTDFSKAFDKVPHGRLLHKVKSYAIQGEVANWMQNLLDDIKQRVVVEGCFSDRRLVTSGVPQGSVLCPLLFVIYIDDLDENLGGMVSKFADDIKIGGIVDSEEGYLGLQQDLDQLGQWADEWQMEFNLDKCEVMHFGRLNQGRTYSVNGRALGGVTEQRDLGIQVHSSLKVEAQVDRVVKKAFSMLGFIGQNIEYRSWDVLLKLYKTLVKPHLEYCVQFWSPYYRKDIIKLE